MTDIRHWGQAAVSTVEKIVRSPFGGVPPRPAAPGGSPVIRLPEAEIDGEVAFAQALARRRSTREFSTEPLDLPLLGGLLWSAAGVNRADGGRTAPSARAMYPIDVYVALADGLYLYAPGAHVLHRMEPLDLRRLTGLQAFVDEAPLELVFVEDAARLQQVEEETGEHYGYAEAGAMTQNVYLFCAAHGLGCVVRALIDRPALAHAMRLRPEQRILLAQTVGRPAESAPT